MAVKMILSKSALKFRGNSLFTNYFLKTPFSASSNVDDFERHPQSKYQKVSNFDQMSQMRPFPSIIYFNQLLHSLSKMKHFSHSVNYFKKMCALGIPVDKFTMSIAIKCCCQLYRTNDGFSVLGFCFRRGIAPDVFIFSALLDGLILEDRILEAEIFFKKLIKQKLCEPNVVMYSTMIKGLCKIGNNVIAIQLLRLMGERGCKPDVVAYSNIIDSLCKDKMIDDARNVVTYSTMIQGLFQVGRCGDARKLFDEMHGKGQMPDQLTYGIILEGLCNNHHIEEALSLFHLMGDSKLNTDIVVYNILIDGASKCGKLDIAKALFKHLTNKGLHPNARTYNVMIGGLCREGLVGDAKQLFLIMEESGCPPNNVTYNVLLQGYLKIQYYDDVEFLLHEMDGRRYSLDATTLSLFLDQIAAGLLDNTLLELTGKLVPKE